MVLNNFSHFLAFEEIPESERSYASRLAEFGNALLVKRQFGPALERFDAAIRAQPDCLSALVGRVRALRGLNRYSLALQSLHHVEALSPEPQAGLLLEKAELWVKLRKFSLAREVCDASLSLAPNCLRAHALRLRLLWHSSTWFPSPSPKVGWSIPAVQPEAMSGLVPVVAPVE